MRQVMWLLAGVAVAVLFTDWIRLRAEVTSARGQIERCVTVSDIKGALADSCISSLALCAARDDGRETIFRAYMNAGARSQVREADQQRADLRVLRSSHARQ